MTDYELAGRFLPIIMEDENETIPIRNIGYMVARNRQTSDSFPGVKLDPAGCDCDLIIEYSVYYDFDIQHLYDLEHIWVAVRDGKAVDCWGSFHGMRLRMAQVPGYHTEDEHPVIYEEPGKHAMLPDPALQPLHAQFGTCCNIHAGGGLLIKDMFAGEMSSNPETDAAIYRYIREKLSFEPSGSFRKALFDSEKNLIPWEELKKRIPIYVKERLKEILG